MDLLNYFGKFHPIILHLPIGFLFLAFMMQVHDYWKKQQQFRRAISFALFWGMLSAVLAAASGYFLANAGGYDEDLLSRHQWLGFIVAGLSILLFFAQKQNRVDLKKIYFPFFILTTILLIATGHFGGSITHGNDFLDFSNSKTTQRTIVDIENAIVFDDLIQPLLQEKCVRCHNPSKTKGDLLMTTIEGLEKGGKTGALFVKGDAEHSLMLERIHLPLEEKKHMPPKGKKQLLDDEIALLYWWIKEGADFKAKVKEVQKDEKIQAILNKYITPKEGLEAVKVPMVELATLEEIQAKGIPINKIAENSSFVAVDLSRRKDLDEKTLKHLLPVAPQLIRLNLAGTNIQDKDLKALPKFPHLEQLYLQQTAITDEGLSYLANLDYLSYLNLYQTKISDKGLVLLTVLKRLQELFIWQTATTQQGIDQFIASKPKTEVNKGVDASIFGDTRLKAPLIFSEKDLFRDSLLVELKMNFKGVNIYYTLDGSEPDSLANLYTAPIKLEKSATLKTVAQKEGWKSSEVATKHFARTKYTPVNVRLDNAPNKKYAAKGARSLVDLKKGSTTFTDGLWLGYEKEHLTAFLDLGKTEKISAVTVGALEATASYIFYPKGIAIALSTDGKNYQKVQTAEYPIASENRPSETRNFIQTFPEQAARYLKVTVESHLFNPEWHPAPGAPCWLFVDEISVE